MSLRFYRLSLPCLIIPILGCGGGVATIPANRAVSFRRFGTLELTLLVPKTSIALHEPMPYTFAVRNAGTQTVKISSGVGCLLWHKVTQGSRTVDAVEGCVGDFWNLSLAPGETKTYSTSWYQPGGASPPGPGEYTLTVWLPADMVDQKVLSFTDAERSLTAGSVQFSIK